MFDILLCEQSEVKWNERFILDLCWCEEDWREPWWAALSNYILAAGTQEEGKASDSLFSHFWMRKCFLVQELGNPNSNRAAASVQLLNSTCNSSLCILKECWLIWECFHQLEKKKTIESEKICKKAGDHHVLTSRPGCAVQSCFPAPGHVPHRAVVVRRHTPVFQVWPHSIVQLCTFLRLNFASCPLSPFPFRRLSV